MIQTPLIDRSIFFDNPTIAGGQLSPDGRYVSFIKEHKGIMNIWVKAFDERFEEAKLLTASDTPITGYFWTYDGRYILYIDDNQGDENYNIFAVNPMDAPVDLVPSSRNLTPLNEVTAQIYQVSKKNPDELLIGLNERDKAWHDLYRLTISTGTLNKLFENHERITGWGFDWDETLRLAYRTDKLGNSEILAVLDNNQFKTIYTTTVKESAHVVGWNKDNTKCFLVSNKGKVDLSSLYEMDPNTGETSFLEQDPDGKVDFASLFMTDNTRQVVYSSYILHKRNRIWRDQQWKSMHASIEQQFPTREIGYTSFTSDYSKMLIAVSGDRFASDIYYYDSTTKELIHQYTPRPRLKAIEQHLVPMEPISYPSSDGMQIPAYLSLPSGTTKKKRPLVVLVHGGPKGPRDYWGYDAYAQFLANRGYAVLQPNFRASGGYGKAFLNAGDKEWGKKMQDDISWGVKHLIEQKLVDPSRVGIMGGSYGGYATLAGLAFTPELYTCGVDIVGPSNLFTLLDSIPAYWESGRAWLYEMVGDPSSDEGKALLHAASPLFHADQINSPLLIVQGANDPRVKKAEADQIAIALRDKGHDVQYLCADDEGHGFRKPLNRMAMFAKTEEFLAKHLGGRYQSEVPKDVALTLDQITIDIDTVTYTPVQAITPSVLPTMTLDTVEGKRHYSVQMTIQEQILEMTMVRTTSKEKDNWVIEDVIEGSMGHIIDRAYYNSSFQPVQRHLNQADQQMTLQYNKEKVTFLLSESQSTITSKTPFVIDGPGYDLFIHQLKLNIGQQASYFVIDIMSAKAKQVVLTRVDELQYISQSVENEQDRREIYIDQNTGFISKMIAVLPAMQNATMRIEAI